MIHENVLFGYDYDDESNTLIAKDWIRNYGFFSTFTLMLTSIMIVYKKFGVLVDNIDSKNCLYLLKKEIDLDYDIYHRFFKINKNIDDSLFIKDTVVPFSPDDHHTVYKEEYVKYYKPFFDRYFTLSENTNAVYSNLKQKYNFDFENSISIVYRDTDKFTDFGGFNYVCAAPYYRLAHNIKEKDRDCKVYIQTESNKVMSYFRNAISATFIEETGLVKEDDTAPLIHYKKDLLNWADNYISSLYLHAQSKYLITYTGNSSLFLYLKRGTTKNMYQEITFTKNYMDFFYTNQ